MGILVNKILTVGGGIQVPKNSLILAEISIAIPVFYHELENPEESESEENQVVQKYRRVIRYGLKSYQSIAAWKEFDGADQLFPKEIPMGWAKEMTDEEYDKLIDNGAHAEVWLAEYLDSVLGGDYCTVVNALE